MENNPEDPIQSLVNKWQALSLAKKVITGVALSAIAFLVYLAIMANFMASTTGLSGDSINYIPNAPTSMDGVRMSNPTSRPSVMESEYVTGADAEQFETRDYRATIETSRLADSCQKIESLKPRPEVTFLSATNGKASCYFGFKVENSQTESVLSVIKDLKPKELQQNISTIKKQIENSLNQRDILNKNLAATEEILNEALTAYDNLLSIATAEGNATALATAVREKIALIDQLKQRREQTRQAIDYLNQQLAEQEDRLSYTYFTVSITERKYISGDRIKDSWKYEMERFVNSVNDLFQQLSLGLISFILHTLLYALYVIIFFVIVKVGYRILKKIWRA